MVRGGGAAFTVIVRDLVDDCLFGNVESSTMNVVGFEFVAVGVPVIAPVELRERPDGSDEPLAMENVYGCVPPEAES
jgi:hypothetical protein